MSHIYHVVRAKIAHFHLFVQFVFLSSDVDVVLTPFRHLQYCLSVMQTFTTIRINLVFITKARYNVVNNSEVWCLLILIATRP